MKLVLVKSMHRHPGDCSPLFVLAAVITRQGKPSPSPDLPSSSRSRRNPLQRFQMLWSLPSLDPAEKEIVEGKGDDTWGQDRIYPHLLWVSAIC